METFETGNKGENLVVRFLEYIGAEIIHKSNPNEDGDYDIRFKWMGAVWDMEVKTQPRWFQYDKFSVETHNTNEGVYINNPITLKENGKEYVDTGLNVSKAHLYCFTDGSKNIFTILKARVLDYPYKKPKVFKQSYKKRAYGFTMDADYIESKCIKELSYITPPISPLELLNTLNEDKD